LGWVDGRYVVRVLEYDDDDDDDIVYVLL
jgi:hypothetical protein